MGKERKVVSLWDAFLVFLSYLSPKLLFSLILILWTLRFTNQRPFSVGEITFILFALLYWPFQEWWMHRWILHLAPIKIFGKEYELFFSRKHREHHEFPLDIALTLLPVRIILTSLLSFSLVVYLVTNDYVFVLSFMGTATISTTLYEWVHYLTHTDYKPKGSYYRKIWVLHRLHHYKNEKYWFSFTVPYIDSWLGTGPDAKTVKHSQAARELRKKEGA